MYYGNIESESLRNCMRLIQEHAPKWMNGPGLGSEAPRLAKGTFGRVLKLYKLGWKNSDIARKEKCSEGYCDTVVSKAKAEGMNIDFASMATPAQREMVLHLRGKWRPAPYNEIYELTGLKHKIIQAIIKQQKQEETSKK